MKTILTTALWVFGLCCSSISSAKDFDYQTAAAKVDQFVIDYLEAEEMQAYATIADDVFVRRAYLSVIGRIPTWEEAQAFLVDETEARHTRLIEQLLANDVAYTSHHYHFWADLLRISSNNHWALFYREWVRENIAANTPFDEFARKIVSGHGLVFDDPAAAYYIRDTGMALDNMSNTVRIFLGTRLECAQCHNHPFDKWTQMDFYKMAAFTYDFDHRGGGRNRGAMLNVLGKEARQAYIDAVGIEGFPVQTDDEHFERWFENHGARYLKNSGMDEATLRENYRKGRDAFEQVKAYNEPISFNISKLGNMITYTEVRDLDRELTLPHDYAYRDAAPHDVVEPGTMFGLDVAAHEDPIERKKAYAEWLTSPENPRFTQVIVNRLWKKAFGHGLYEPLDDLTDYTVITHPELLAYLQEIMVELDYDVRAFQRVLYSTQLFRREAYGQDHPLGMPYHFAGPMLQRMSAEQIWDSIGTLILPDIDHHMPNRPKLLDRLARTKAIHKSMEGSPMEEVLERMREAGARTRDFQPEKQRYEKLVLAAYDAGDKEKAKALTAELKEKENAIQRHNQESVLIYLKDGKATESMMMGMTGGMGGAEDQSVDVIQNLKKKAYRRKAPEHLDAAAKKRWNDREGRMLQEYNKVLREMARASDLESPARRGHFLRDFGQSDRETIENASYNASVPQSLYLLNSPLAVAVHNHNSTLGAQLEAAESPEEKVKLVFRIMLTREPTGEEVARVMSDYTTYEHETIEDLVWALLNSRQFLFVK